MGGGGRRTGTAATRDQLQDPWIIRALVGDVRLAWFWLPPRLYLGLTWLAAGRRHGADAADGGGNDAVTRLVATGETLVGIALLLGLCTGLAALVGGALSVQLSLTDTAVMTPALFAAAVAVILAWKTAGWIGFDRWLLPAAGMPWDGGRLFGPWPRSP